MLLCVPEALRPNYDQILRYRLEVKQIKLRVFGIVCLVVLTGCAGSDDSACKSLNAEWSRNVFLLAQLPSDFSPMTQEQGVEWSALQDAKKALEIQINSLENCAFEYKFSG